MTWSTLHSAYKCSTARPRQYHEQQFRVRPACHEPDCNSNTGPALQPPRGEAHPLLGCHHHNSQLCPSHWMSSGRTTTLALSGGQSRACNASTIMIPRGRQQGRASPQRQTTTTIQEAENLRGETVQYIVIHKWLCTQLLPNTDHGEQPQVSRWTLGYGNFKTLCPCHCSGSQGRTRKRGNGEWTLQVGMR